MKTLTLVPLNNTLVNPEEIAAISFGQSNAVITFKSNQTAVVIRDMTAAQVIERLQKHIRLAAGIEDVCELLKKSKDEKTAQNTP